jgi:hypothetical protein
MRAKAGRPKRKDNPQKLTVILSARAMKALNKLSAMAPSRGYVIEKMIEQAEAAR